MNVPEVSSPNAASKLFQRRRVPFSYFLWLLVLLCFSPTNVQAFPPSATSKTTASHSGSGSGTSTFSRQREREQHHNSMVKPVKPTRSNPSLFQHNNHKDSKLKLSVAAGAGASAASLILPLMDISNPLWKAMGTYAAADLVGFVISLATGSHVHLDLIGTGAFALVSLRNIFSATATVSQKVSSIAVSLWSIKLASFLFYRATRVGHDLRLEDTLSTIPGMFGFWVITFLWNACCSLPYLLGLLSTKSSASASDPVFLTVGSLVFIIGLLIETTADAQKWVFKQNPDTRGQFCNVGLWSISQHPNFLGNLILWSGIFLMNVPSLMLPVVSTSTSTGSVSFLSSTLAHLWSYRRVALALLSPLFMWSLLNGQAQGGVTNATELAASKYGNDPAYQQYLDEVPPILPKLW
jgi:steroid 5-alpha reductase family enzyme